jgi:hypothetical protein
MLILQLQKCNVGVAHKLIPLLEFVNQVYFIWSQESNSEYIPCFAHDGYITSFAPYADPHNLHCGYGPTTSIARFFSNLMH